MKIRILFLLVALTVLQLVPEATAQWSSLPSSPNLAVTLPVDASAASTRTLVADGAGGVFLVWSDTRDVATGDQGELFAQHIDANGQRLWGIAGKPVSIAPGLQWEQAACADGVGGLYVAWADLRPAGDELYVQHLGPDGEPLWAVDGIKLTMPAGVAYNWVYIPQVVTAPDGGLYLSYVAGARTRAQRLTTAGVVAPGWPVDGVEIPDALIWANRALVLTQLPGGTEPGVLVATVNAGQAMSIVTKVGADGLIKFSRQVVLNSIEALTALPKDFCSDGAGGILFVAQANQYLYAHRVLADGTIAWSYTVAEMTDNGGYAPEIVPGENGGGILTWVKQGAVAEARAQKFSGTGVKQWGAAGVLLFSGNLLVGSESMRTTVSDGAGGVNFGVMDEPNYRAQRLNAAGQPLWGASGVVMSINTGTAHAIASDGSSGVISFHSGAGRNFYVMRATLAGSLGSNSPLARLANMSARAFVGSGTDVLIPGFVVSGGNLQLLVRGIGPTLANAPYNVTGVLADPRIELFNAANQSLGANDDWGLAANAATIATVAQQVFAFPLAANSKDAAMHVTLAPGLYTAVMRGAGTTTGVGLVELYEVGGASNAGRLANMSVRAQVGTGANVLIPGIVIGGSDARTLLIRAIGPTLASFNVTGVLANPQITLFNQAGASLGGNDNWSTPNGAQITAVGAQVFAFPLPAGSADAAMLITLAPGLYTAQVSGVGNTTGVCLVEVYEVP